MIQTTTLAISFLVMGILTSVSVLSVYQILFTIPLAYFSYLAIKNKKWSLPLSAWLLLIFAMIALVSLLINFEILPSPSKNFGRLKYLLYGSLGIFAIREWNLKASDKAKKRLINLFLGTIVISGVFAIGEYFSGNDDRARGLTDTMRYGYGSSMFLLTLLSVIFHQEKLKKWISWQWLLPVFFIGFMGMYFTHTRGAMLGFLSGLPFVLYFFRPKFGLILGSIVVLAIISLGLVYLFGSGNYKSRYLTNKENASDVIRRSQWQAAILAIKEKPILGYGYSNFHSQLKRIKDQYNLDAKDYNDAHSHNLFLEIGAGTGLIGLIFFCSWLIFWAVECFQKKGMVRALVIPFGVALIVSSQFEVTLDANNASMIFFLYALSSVFEEKNVESI
jgi:O-antigen ligase